MASRVQKKPASTVQKKPAARVMKKPAASASARSRSPRGRAIAPAVLNGVKAFVVNLERRPDRWVRVSEMLRKEVPWLEFEQFKASDGTQRPIPEDEVAGTWNTRCNAHYADYYQWVFDMPGTALDGTQWKWACDACAEDEEWRFAEDGDEEWSFIQHAGESIIRTGSVEKIATGEKFKVKLQFSQEHLEPGHTLRMSGGERGCAHSHLRLWRVAAERQEHTLVLEDDVQMIFERTDGELAMMDGMVFTERLRRAMEHAPSDFDVIYLGWSGWRGGHHKIWKQDYEEDAESAKFIRKAEYVWTTVAYVLSQAGAKKLLAVGLPLNQPVDNFMAWEASQGRLKSYVALDQGDDDGTWAGGIVDQCDFQGDSDIKKSDGGHQGDDEKDFAVPQ